jgi:hypothetical protein
MKGRLLMDRFRATATLAGVLVLALGMTAGAAEESAPAAADGPVYIDHASLFYQGADPVQVSLTLSGDLPTPCHQPRWTVTAGDATIAISLWSIPGEGMCAAVLEPFELIIPLDDAIAGSPVELNGEPVGIVAGAGDIGAVTGLAGAGTSFGMCAGTCVRDLRVDADALTLRGHEHMLAEPVFTNRGQLTVDGQAAVDAAVAGIDNEELQAVYGCPDCADGGAAWVRLEREGGVSEHVMEFGAPPEALAELYEVSAEITASLEACQDSGLVAVAADCVPAVEPAATT